MSNVINILQSVLVYSCPLLFVSLGVLVMEIAGIVNMGAEGMMVMGCLSAVVINYYTGSIWIGTLGSMAIASVFTLLFGYLVQEMHLNQCVLGIAFNLIGVGLTTTLNRAFFDGLMTDSTYPQIGPFQLVVYLGFVVTAIFWYVLNKMKAGVQLKAVGENPIVVESVGLSVKKIRYVACAVGGALVGLGGTILSTGQLNRFTENMTDGRGFIALAAVTFGKYTPFGTLGGVLVFGLGEALSYRMQAGQTIIAYDFALMLPYVVTVVALCLFSRNAHDPAALGKPYEKAH